MNKEVLVSIICITYNHENFIKKAIEGFLIQKVNFKYEILIHDDASTDKTIEILKEYEEKYSDIIKIIYQKENQYSQGKDPIKYLYDLANGKYLSFCEGDDYWIDEYKLQKQIDFLEKNKEYSATYHNTFVVNKIGELYYEYQDAFPLFKSHEITIKDLERSKILSGQLATIVCRNFWKKWTKFQKSIYLKADVNGDEKLSVTFPLEGKVYYFEEIMSCYRRTFDTESWNSRNRNRDNKYYFSKSCEILKKYLKEMYNYDLEMEFTPSIYVLFSKTLKKPNLKNIKNFYKGLEKIKISEVVVTITRTIVRKNLKKFKKIFKTKEKKNYWELLKNEKEYYSKLKS